MNMNTGLRMQLASCVIMVVFLSCIFSVKLLSRSHEIHHHEAVDSTKHVESRHNATSPNPVVPKRVQQLLDATRAAAQAANGGVDPPSLSPEERLNWTQRYPCRSRAELEPMYARRKGVRDMADNPLWEMVLEEYIKLHRICMKKVGGNLRESFLAKNATSPGCKFAIADVDFGIPAGLSNRILSTTSVVLYAILTQRVVLVPKSTLVTSLMCEPFPGSSWDLDSYSPFSFYPWSEEAKHIWVFHEDLYAELDEGMANQTAAYLDSPRSNVFAASMGLSQYHPDSRFFCDTEQASFSGVTWLYFTGCIYTIPKFFAVPAFRHTLDALFPGRFVLTQMLRSIMLPQDSAWEKVVESDAAHFPKVDHRVGIQVRYYYGKAQYFEMNDVFNERILSCAIENGILPSQKTTAGNASAPLPEGKSVQVFIASLYTGFYEHVANGYLSSPLVSGDNVTLTQLTNNSVQLFGVDVDTQSLVEIFLLSFSDTLLNTPISTFGGLAQAYGSLIPWKIETRKGDGLPACERDTTVDLCYQTAEMRYSCPYNNVNGLRISDLAPYFQTCLYNFTQVGLQLTTDHSKVPLSTRSASSRLEKAGLQGTSSVETSRL